MASAFDNWLLDRCQPGRDYDEESAIAEAEQLEQDLETWLERADRIIANAERKRMEREIRSRIAGELAN